MYRKMPGSWRTSRLRKKRRKWVALHLQATLAQMSRICADNIADLLHGMHRLAAMPYSEAMGLSPNVIDGTRSDYSTARGDAAMYARIWGAPLSPPKTWTHVSADDAIEALANSKPVLGKCDSSLPQGYENLLDAIEQRRATGEGFWDADGNLIDSGRVKPIQSDKGAVT